MKVLVTTKTVLEPEATPSVSSGRIQTAGIKRIVDPSDEASLQAAVCLKRAGLATTITAVCIGTDADKAVIRQALALGADEAVLIKHKDAIDGTLCAAAAIRRLAMLEEYKLVLLGNKSSDNESGLTAAYVASFLGWPQLSNVIKLASNRESIRALCLLDNNTTSVWFEAKLPCVISCNTRASKPQFVSLAALASAKTKKLRVKTPPPPLSCPKLTILTCAPTSTARISNTVTDTASALEVLLNCIELAWKH